MITPKPLGNAIRLEVADDPLPGALTNLVKNPSGELGTWGWLTPVAGSRMTSTLVTGGRALLYVSPTPGGVASFFTTEALPITPNWYVAASWQIPNMGFGYSRVRFEWLTSAQVLISSSVQSSYNSNTIVSTAAPVTISYGPLQAPATAAFVRFRFDVYSDASGTPPNGGDNMTINNVTVAQAATSAALGTTKTNLVGNPGFEADVSGWTVLSPATTLTRNTSQHQDGVASARLLNISTSVRTNLLTNPSVETNLTGWTGDTNSTVTRNTTGGSHGPACIRTAGGAGGGGGNIVVLQGTQNIAVTPGEFVRVRADVQVGTTWDTDTRASVGFRWYDTATHLLAPTYWGVGDVTAPRSVWFTVDGAIKVPTGAVFCRPFVLVLNAHSAATSSDVYLVDAVLVEKVASSTSLVGGYIDGAQTGSSLVTYAWTGTAHASTSTETTKIAVSNPFMNATSFAVTGGAYYTASAYLKHDATVSGPRTAYLGFTWLDASNNVVSSTKYSVGTTTSAFTRMSTTVTAPVNAAKLIPQVILDSLEPNGAVFVDAVLVELGQTLNPYYAGTVSSTNLSFVEPITYVNILGTTHDLTVTREALNVGTLSAHIVDSSLDPSQDSLIRPGRATRLTAYDGVLAMWRPIFTGTATHAAVEYDLTEPNATKRAHIELTAVDNAQALANQNRAEGVGTITELPYVLEGAGVPWNVNGNGNQVATAIVVANNDSASALDQVAVTRDSVLGYAWVDRRGVLQAWDRAQLPTTLAGAELTETSYRDVVVGFDTDALINEVNVRFLTYNAGETSEVMHGPYRNETSIAEWGVHSAEFAVQGLNDDEASMIAYANAILTANSTPVVRLNSMELTVDLTTDWSAVAVASWWAWADLYDLAQVTCARASISKAQARITGIQHTLSGPESKWTTELLFNANSVVASPTFTPSPSGGAGGLTISQLLRPLGEVTMYWGTKASIPSGWLALDGSTFDGAAYPDLAALLGGTTLPNFTDRMPVGAGTKALGTSGGNPTVTLTAAQLAHTHGAGSIDTGSTGSGHTHGITGQVAGASVSAGTSSGNAPSFGNWTGHNHGGDTGQGTGHTHNVTGSTAAVSLGSPTAVDSLPPWRALWFLIRAR